MRLLVDSNVFLEILLRQEKADEAVELLSSPENHEFFISDFALHSIGLILFYKRKHGDFVRFVQDTIVEAGILELRLPAERMQYVAEIATQFGLDFDDAYQYAVAQEYGLTLVSLDADFDRTLQGRMTPTQVLKT